MCDVSVVWSSAVPTSVHPSLSSDVTASAPTSAALPTPATALQPATSVPTAPTARTVGSTTSMPAMYSTSFQPPATTAEPCISSPTVTSTTPAVTASTVAVSTVSLQPPICTATQTATATAAGAEFRPIFPPSLNAAVSSSGADLPTYGLSTVGGFTFNPSSQAAGCTAQTTPSTAPSLFQSAPGFRSIFATTRTSSAVSFGTPAATTTAAPTSSMFSFSAPGTSPNAPTPTAVQSSSSPATSSAANCVWTTVSWPLSSSSFSPASVPSAFPSASLLSNQFSSRTSTLTSSSAAPVQHLFPFRPNENNNNLFQIPQANNAAGMLGSNSTISFGARPDLINATTTTVSQPTFNFGAGQLQPSSAVFPIANHGASQPTGFGSLTAPAVTSAANPVFGFGNHSVGATPSAFGAVTTQNSFQMPFGFSNQNNQNVAFQNTSVPSAFNFGQYWFVTT